MKRLLILLALVTIAATSCARVTPYAAIVNGEVIEPSTVQAEIESTIGNEEYARQLEQNLASAGGLQPGGDNTVSTQYAISVLYNRILGTLISQELQKEGVEVTEQQRNAVSERLRGSGENAAVFDSLPADYRDYVVEVQAQLQALIDARNTEDAQRRFFAENPELFRETCFRQIVLPDATVADNFRNRLLAGENFETVARDAASALDPTGASGFEPQTEPQCAPGGELSDFARSVLDPVPVNGVTEPIEQSGGVFLVQVTSRTDRSFAEAKEAIVERLSSRERIFTDLLEGADIKVNPRYGTFRPANELTGQQAGIAPHQPVQLSDGRQTAGPAGFGQQFGS